MQTSPGTIKYPVYEDGKEFFTTNFGKSTYKFMFNEDYINPFSEHNYVFRKRKKLGQFIRCDEHLFLQEDTDLNNYYLIIRKSKMYDWVVNEYEKNKKIREYEKLFNQCFKNLFFNRFLNYNTEALRFIQEIVIPKDDLDKINSLIESFNLMHISEFIFQIIMKAQQTYIKRYYYFDFKNSHSILEKDDLNILNILAGPTEIIKNSERLMNLLKIEFKYECNVKREITSTKIQNRIIKFLEDDFYNRIGIKWYDVSINKKPMDLNPLNFFIYPLVRSIHSFFLKTKTIELKNKKSSSMELECIAQILEFALIPIKNKENKILQMKDDRERIIRIVRNWVHK